jgi:hypothetical protein
MCRASLFQQHNTPLTHLTCSFTYAGTSWSGSTCCATMLHKGLKQWDPDRVNITFQQANAEAACKVLRSHTSLLCCHDIYKTVGIPTESHIPDTKHMQKRQWKAYMQVAVLTHLSFVLP